MKYEKPVVMDINIRWAEGQEPGHLCLAGESIGGWLPCWIGCDPFCGDNCEPGSAAAGDCTCGENAGFYCVQGAEGEGSPSQCQSGSAAF